MRHGRSSCTPCSPTTHSRALAILLFLALALPAPSWADELRPFLGVHGTLSTFAMSDVNQDIGTINTALVGTGLSMDEIHSGAGAGVSAGLEFPGPLSAGLGYDRLFASSEVGDFSGSLKYDFPANLYRAFLHYGLAEGPTTGAFLGAALGIVSEAGRVGLSVTGSGSAHSDVRGTGPLFELYAGGDVWASPQFALTGSAGYRYAKVREVEADGSTVFLESGQKMSIDYSGVFLRLGLKLAMAQ